ncbi:hypothetical protein EYF80_042078 [Liparis tanakae]|uniref:Uncharacterized protein n=1 Tax=Liparis tanakae TaxID=230148 RepID=A0A4Z2G330_9TELE|nr:hypothetical protein EYF80_042078 [Liparis tanakae]
MAWLQGAWGKMKYASSRRKEVLLDETEKGKRFRWRDEKQLASTLDIVQVHSLCDEFSAMFDPTCDSFLVVTSPSPLNPDIVASVRRGADGERGHRRVFPGHTAERDGTLGKNRRPHYKGPPGPGVEEEGDEKRRSKRLHADWGLIKMACRNSERIAAPAHAR